MVYLAVVPMALGFLTWGYALAPTTAGQLGSTMYLVTPLAVLLGWLLLGEVPPALALVGGLLCVARVYVARRAVNPEGAASSSPSRARPERRA
jgi:drug/metabolite transporter (DMT)-like permease